MIKLLGRLLYMIPERNQIVFMSLEDLVSKDHFLRKLADMFPWDNWAQPFKKCFKGEKEYGPQGYPLSSLLKMTVISFLYGLSDRQTENYVRDNNPARYFVGLGLHQDVPDETTLCRFRGRIIEKRQEKLLKELFDKVLRRASQLGIEMGTVQIMDSVHTESSINKNKEDKENEKRKDKGEPPKPPKDPDATWGCKGKYKRKNPETGELVEFKKFFYGYKTHTTLNSRTRLITSALVSTGKEADIHAARFLLDDDLRKSIPVGLLAADKAYDDGDLHMYCGAHEIFPAISLNKKRTEHKSKKTNEYWLNIKGQPFYKKGLALRYRIEQKYGEAKLFHGLRKTRYCGILKFAFQAILTFMSMNLKRIIKLTEPSTRGRLKPCNT
jgi:transposase, IS5 family